MANGGSHGESLHEILNRHANLPVADGRVQREQVKTLLQKDPSAAAVSSRSKAASDAESPEDVHLVLDGVACRYKLLDGGQRQIIALMLPGDFCDLQVAILCGNALSSNRQHRLLSPGTVVLPPHCLRP